jgi:hypothetical protein
VYTDAYLVVRCNCLTFFFFYIFSFYLKGEKTGVRTHIHVCLSVLRKKNNKKKETTPTVYAHIIEVEVCIGGLG